MAQISHAIESSGYRIQRLREYINKGENFELYFKNPQIVNKIRTIQFRYARNVNEVSACNYIIGLQKAEESNSYDDEKRDVVNDLYETLELCSNNMYKYKAELLKLLMNCEFEFVDIE